MGKKLLLGCLNHLVIFALHDAVAAPSNNLNAKISCKSNQETSRARVYGQADWLDREFDIVLLPSSTLHMSRFTGRHERPDPGCVGIGCVQPIYEGDIYLKVVGADAVEVKNENRTTIFVGEGALDFSGDNGFRCLVDVYPFR